MANGTMRQDGAYNNNKVIGLCNGRFLLEPARLSTWPMPAIHYDSTCYSIGRCNDTTGAPRTPAISDDSVPNGLFGSKAVARNRYHRLRYS